MMAISEDVMDLGNMADRWRSMGYDVIEVNGHDVMELQAAFLQETEKPKPSLHIRSREKAYPLRKIMWTGIFHI